MAATDENPPHVLRGRLLPRKPRPDTDIDRRTAENAFIASIEDGALAAGGLVATIAGVLNSSDAAIFGIVVAAVGKSAPSICRELRDMLIRWPQRHEPKPEANDKTPDSPPDAFLADAQKMEHSQDPVAYGTGLTHFLDGLADGQMLLLSAAAGLLLTFNLLRGANYPIWVMLALVGAAFVAKSVIDLAEDGYISVHSTDEAFKSDDDSSFSSRGTESMLFLVFGASALLVGVWDPSNPARFYALGLAALGKALPSLAPSKSSGGGDSSLGSAPSYDLYEIRP